LVQGINRAVGIHFVVEIRTSALRIMSVTQQCTIQLTATAAAITPRTQAHTSGFGDQCSEICNVSSCVIVGSKKFKTSP